MRKNGLKWMVCALGLALAPAVQAAPGAATALPAAEEITPANPGDITPAPGEVTEPLDSGGFGTPADPTLDADGVPTATAVPGAGMPTDGTIALQEQFSPVGEQAADFHNVILLPLITIISLIVLGLLAWVVVRYRRAANPVPSKTSHNTTIEVIWTLVPVLILVAIAIPSIRLLAAQYEPAPDNAVTIKAIGNQWFWSYEYPDHGDIQFVANMLREQNEVGEGERFRTDVDGPRLLATDNRVVLPVGTPIRLITTANDVIHSWAMPAFWVKLDAIPGRLNETTFTISEPGVYFGQCSELCGARHAYMPIVVQAVEPAVFEQWVLAKGGAMPGSAAETGDVDPLAEGSDLTDDTATPSGVAVPDQINIIDNTVAAPVATNQSATDNTD